MFDKKQKSCVTRIDLVTDDGLYDRKAFYTVKTFFIHPLKINFLCFVSCDIFALQIPKKSFLW